MTTSTSETAKYAVQHHYEPESVGTLDKCMQWVHMHGSSIWQRAVKTAQTVSVVSLFGIGLAGIGRVY